jgi:ABC-type phosphate transport system substrate-binding protein
VSNPLSSIKREELSRIFLKKVTKWPDGRAVIAVDLFENSPVRSRFSTEVHGRPAGALRAYWQQKIYSGSGLPPITKPSDQAVAAFVQDNPNAVGYLSLSAPPPDRTKVLTVVP